MANPGYMMVGGVAVPMYSSAAVPSKPAMDCPCTCNGKGAQDTGVLYESQQANVLYYGPYCCRISQGWAITFNGSNSDDMAILLPQADNVAAAAGDPIVYTIPASGIIFRDTLGWMGDTHGDPVYDAISNKRFTQGGNTWNLDIHDGIQHHVSEMDASGITTYPWSTSFTYQQLKDRGFIDGDGNLCFKFALILSGGGRLQCAGMTCVAPPP